VDLAIFVVALLVVGDGGCGSSPVVSCTVV